MSQAFRANSQLLLTAVMLITSQTLFAQSFVENEQRPEHRNEVSSWKPVQGISKVSETLVNGNSTITVLRSGDDGLARLRHGDFEVAAESIVVFDVVTDAGHDLRIYAEDRVDVRDQNGRRNAAVHTRRLPSVDQVQLKARFRSEIDGPNELMKRARRRLWPSENRQVVPVSAQAQLEEFEPPQFPAVPQAATPLTRRVQIRPRSSTPLQFDSQISTDTVPAEKIYIFTGGVNVIVDGMQLDVSGRQLQTGAIDLSADKVVIWTPDTGNQFDNGGGVLEQTAGNRLQIYLEGNILVRQDQNTVSATHAFYDAGNDRALLLNAELRAFLPQTGGTFRVRAERLRQLSRQRFHAQNAWTTTSPYGKPGYRLQASDIFVEPGPVSPFTELDPYTRQPVNGPPLWVTSLNSQFILGDVPLFWTPRLTAPAEDPNIPIRRAVVKHDRIFGLQVKTVWNLSKILGQPKQQGMQWDLLADYLSERGPGIGVQGNYDVQTNAGRANGIASIIYQYDDDRDNLGQSRQSLDPESNNRGQIIWRHKQDVSPGTTLFGEIGYISDENYRESYHEIDYDTGKDVETILGIRRDVDAWSGQLWGRTELNEFETSTDWLPRADLYGFSQPLFGNLQWSSHSSVGYADLERGRAPTDPNEPYTPLAQPYYADNNGLVAMTRHQVDAPFMLGALNINPFVMGEAAFWDEGLIAEDVDRYLLSTGVQAHISATKVLPFVRDEFWGLNGLAHKVDTYLDYRYTDSSRGLSEIPQYNEFDENAQERFRHRYAIQIYPGLIPNEFDPRFYALRNGAGMWVSAPYHEIADDQQVLRLRFRNRLQTKAGPLNSQRIRDWMIWEYGASFFPEADRDNFGEDFGLIFGNYRWNVSDRTSILADGSFDLFDNSQQVWSVGLLSQRSLRGSMYLGFRQVKAADFLDSQTLVASYSYQLSPKWISTGSFAYDVADGTARGTSLTVSRVGLDFVVHFGFGIDTSKNNVGVAFAVEPRFGPPTATNLSYLLGLQ